MIRYFNRFMSNLIATVENNIIKMPDLEAIGFKANPHGLGSALFDAMNKHKNKTAQIDVTTGASETYETLLWKSVRTAIHLKNNGVTKGDIISTCTTIQLNGCVPFIAAVFIGARFVGLDPRFPETYLMSTLKLVSPKYVFVETKYTNIIEDILVKLKLKTNIVAFDEDKEYLNFESFLKSSPDEKHFIPYKSSNIHETVIITFTSGTQGPPKPMCLSHYAILGQTHLFCGLRKIKLNVILHYATYYWVSAVVFLSGAAFHGSCQLLNPIFDINTIWNLLDKYKVSFLLATTVVANLMVKSGLPKGMILDHFIELCIGGSVISKETVDGIKSMLPKTRIVQFYGMAEAGGVITSFNYEDPKIQELAIQNPNSSGLPLYGLWYKIVDLKTGKPLGENQEGELYIQTKFIAHNCFQTQTVQLTSDGWFPTNDILYYDKNLCFYVTDRKDSIIFYKNESVSPSIIENVINQHPAVKEAAVVGIPHPEDGNHIFGLVVLKDDAKNISPEDIQNYVKTLLKDKYHLRGGCRFINKLPYTPTGKVMRRDLTTLIKDGKT